MAQITRSRGQPPPNRRRKLSGRRQNPIARRRPRNSQRSNHGHRHSLGSFPFYTSHTSESQGQERPAFDPFGPKPIEKWKNKRKVAKNGKNVPKKTTKTAKNIQERTIKNKKKGKKKMEINKKKKEKRRGKYKVFLGGPKPKAKPKPVIDGFFFVPKGIFFVKRITFLFLRCLQLVIKKDKNTLLILHIELIMSRVYWYFCRHWVCPAWSSYIPMISPLAVMRTLPCPSENLSILKRPFRP